MPTTRIFNFTKKAMELVFYFLFAIIPFIFVPQMSELFEMPKMFLVYSGTVLIIFFWAVKNILCGKFLFRRTILDIPLLLFLLSSTFSTFVSIDVHTSIFGYYSRVNGGLLSAICYSLLYWAWVSNMSNHQTLTAKRFLLASALLISLWAILEHFGHSISCLLLQKGNFGVSCWAPKVQERVFATFGQPNWLAAWLVMIAPLTWLPIFSRRLPYIPTSSIIFAAILFTRSRSGIAAFAIAFAIFWGITLLKNRSFIKQFVFLSLSLLTITSLFGTPWSPPINNVIANLNSRQSVQSPKPPQQGTESFNVRKIVWKGAIDIWKENPILGTGPETFAYSYYNVRPKEHNLTSEWDLLYNKAHNEYLNYLANTGVVGLTSYLLLICATLWQIARSKSQIETNNSQYAIRYSLLAGYSSLLVTNFTGFSVASTSLLFFLFPAMTQSAREKGKGKSEQTTRSLVPLFSSSLLVLILLLVTCYLLLRIFGLFAADIRYTQGKKLNELREPKGAVKKLDQALSWKPSEPRYYDELADSTSQIVSLYELSESEMVSIAESTKEISDKSVEISPRNVAFWSNRAIYFKRLANLDEKYLEEAIESLEIAVQLAPTDPSFLYNLAVLYQYAQKPELALTALERAIELKPDYPEPRELLNNLRSP